jgi:hypothetical protein
MRQGDVVIRSGGEFTMAIAPVTARGLMTRLLGPVVVARGCHGPSSRSGRWRLRRWLASACSALSRSRGTLHLFVARKPLQADPAAISAFSALQELLNRAKGNKRSTGQERIMPLKCHSRPVRYSVLCSKNLNNLEPPYGIEP